MASWEGLGRVQGKVGEGWGRHGRRPRPRPRSGRPRGVLRRLPPLPPLPSSPAPAPAAANKRALPQLGGDRAPDDKRGHPRWGVRAPSVDGVRDA